MCRKQDNLWGKVHHQLSHGRLEAFTWRLKVSRQYDQVDEGPIRPRYENLQRKEA